MQRLPVVALLCLSAFALVPTAQAAAAAPDLNPCEHGGQYGADFAAGRLCVSVYWPGCNVWIEWTAIPSQDTCLYRSDGLQASAAAEPAVDCYQVYSRTDVSAYSVVRRNSCAVPETYSCPYEGAPISECEPLLGVRATAAGPECMDVYSQTHVAGPYWLVRRDSCSAQVYECPEGHSPPAAPCRETDLLTVQSAAAPPELPSIECAAIQNRIDLGPVAVVMTSACSGHVEVCGDRVSAALAVSSPDLSCVVPVQPPINCFPYSNEHEVGPVTVVQGGCGNDVRLCDTSVRVGIDASCLVTTTAAQEPMCLYYYYEVEAGPVRHVQRDSCHGETYVCGQSTRDVSDPSLMNPDVATFQGCVRDALDDYVALT